MKENCDCSSKAVSVKPAKFTLEDTYGKYRRQAKREFLQREGLI